MTLAQVEPTSITVNKVLVVEDHPLYSDALALTIAQIFPESEIEKVTTITAAVRLVGNGFAPEMVILDLNLPDVAGIGGFYKIKQKIPDVPVLVISAESSADVIGSLIAAGAAGFVSKDASHSDLKSALLEICEGRRVLPPDYKPMSRPADANGSHEGVAQKIAALTPQQGRIMRLICDGKPNKQIAYELGLAEPTVKAHITAILRRLGVNNRTQAAVLMNGLGGNTLARPGISGPGDG